MQYLLAVIEDGNGNGRVTEAERAAMYGFNQKLEAGGHWVFGGGLGAPDPARVVDNRGGAALVTDGPFVESKEFLAGIWIIEAPDADVAVSLAADASQACNRRIEVRPFL